ncbi:MAG: ogr/Delta-like zinc finger family protein [Neisseria sp.]|nr:ogr/Delta-like zinc finger family protein [Neisseria sp.]
MVKKPKLNRYEGGQMRITVVCPVCGERCKVDGSRMITNRVRHQYGQCLNMRCGWTGVFATEAVKTITPPSPAYDISLAPQPMSKAEIRQHQENQTPQEELI